MTDGRLLLAMAALICLGAFFNGLRFSRMSEEKIMSGRMQIEGWSSRAAPVATVRLIGRIQMIGAPILLLFFVALCFGLMGPVDGIKIIQL